MISPIVLISCIFLAGPASEFCCHFLNVTLWESVQWPGGRGQSPGQITMKKNCIARWRRTAENGWGRVRVKSQIPQGRRLSGHFLHITHTRHRHVSCPSEMFIKSTLQQLRLAVPTADIWTTPLHLPLPLPHKTLPLGSVLLQRFMHFFSVCIGNVCCFSSKTNARVLRPVPRLLLATSQPPTSPPDAAKKKWPKLNNPRFWIFHFCTFPPNCQRRVRAEVALSRCPELAHSRPNAAFLLHTESSDPIPQCNKYKMQKCLTRPELGTSSRRPLTHSLPRNIFCHYMNCIANPCNHFWMLHWADKSIIMIWMC